MTATASVFWVLPLGCGLIALAFWLVWVHQGRRGSGGFACAGFVLSTILTTIDLSRPWLPGALVGIVVPLQWLALWLLAQAFLVRVGLSMPARALAVVAVVPLAWHYHYFFFEPDLMMRNMSSTLMSGAIMLVAAAHVAQRRRNRLDHAIFCVLVLTGAFYVLRVFSFGNSADFDRENWLWSVPMLTLYVGNILSALAAALLLMLAIGMDLIEHQLRETRSDALTGIGNRRAFDDAIAADAAGEVQYAAAIMLDIDHFKAVNDRYGHAMGDAVLVAVAQALEAGPGRHATLARVGGEEFTLLVPMNRHMAAPSVALVAQSTIAALSIDGIAMPLTASAGLALRLPHEALRDTLRRADDALYRAKLEGRNRLMLADDTRVMPGAKAGQLPSPARLAQLAQATAFANDMEPESTKLLGDNPPQGQRIHCPTPIRRAMEPDTRSAASATISSERCAYLVVVSASAWPSSLPITISEMLSRIATEAKLWRRS